MNGKPIEIHFKIRCSTSTVRVRRLKVAEVSASATYSVDLLPHLLHLAFLAAHLAANDL